uniref:Structural protein n=1 Tax=Phoenicurus auroreus ambidensovirus TaxID=2794456 RepID=A0A8A4XDG6_9VIRU|nr:MAG: structural protein [Phoenicurus auroreus ambidensovirus]
MDIVNPGTIDPTNKYETIELGEYERIGNQTPKENAFRPAGSDNSGLRFRGSTKAATVAESSADVSIAIEEATETTLLLGGEAAGAGAAAAGSSTATTAVGAISGVGAVGGGVTAVGYGIKTALGGRGGEKDTFVAKGTHFVGPGNPIDTRPPVSETDAIAKEHDIDYSKAKTAKDIHDADRKAVDAFRKQEGILPKIAGTLLDTKRKVEENLTGVIYPSLPGKNAERPETATVRETKLVVSK